MRNLTCQFLVIITMLVFSACSFNKATHTLYKGRISDTEKITLIVSQISGVKYAHIYYAEKRKGRSQYWLSFNIKSNNNSLSYLLEKHFYRGNKFLFGTKATIQECIDTSLSQTPCIRIQPNEYALLKFIYQNLKEYNYQNRFTEASIPTLKYWVKESP